MLGEGRGIRREEGAEVVGRAISDVEEDVPVAKSALRGVRARGATAGEKETRELPPDALDKSRAGPKARSKLADALPAPKRVAGIAKGERVAPGRRSALRAQVKPGPESRVDAALAAAASHDAPPLAAASRPRPPQLALVPHPPKGLPEDNHVGVVQTDAKHIAELLLESEKGLARKRVASAAADVASQQVASLLVASLLLASVLLASLLLASLLLASLLLASRRARRSS